MYNRRSMIVLLTAAAACFLLSLTSLFGGASPQGKAKPAPPRATVTINSGFDISSDGLEPYVDGQSGVAAQVATAGSYDMILDLSKSSRHFNVAGMYSTGYYITIRQIGNMLAGETRWTRAHFYVEPQFKGTTVFNWCGDLNFTPPAGVTLLQTTNSCNNGDYLVSATCNLFDDASNQCTDWTFSTLDPLDPYSIHINPISALVQATRTTKLLGNYRTSFQLHVQR